METENIMAEKIVEHSALEMYKQDQAKYSVVVNRRRAIPSIKDGLKPVQRRVVYGAYKDGLIMWWCPLQRFVIFPNEIHISHSMRTQINKNRYTLTINRDFDGVIHGCSEKRLEQEGAWLGEDMIKAYTELHNQNLAASVEVWDGDNLVGGLYGVTLGKCFFGESMFSRVPNASKFALIYLAKVFGKHGGVMIDCQLETAHLKSMGGRYISYDEYMKYVNM